MKKILVFLIATLLIVLSGCGTSSQTSSTPTNEKPVQTPASQTTQTTDTSYPLVMKNYTKPEGGAKWTEKEISFDKAPERIVATTRTAAEFLLHLGLGDKIVGVGGVFGIPDKSVEKEFNKLKNLGDAYISKEVAMSVDPDFIFGRGGLFDNADWGVGTVDSLNTMGIKTFVMSSSITDATFDSIYKDIEAISKIFNVSQAGEKFSNELKTRQQAIATSLSRIDKNKTFAYVHGADPENFNVYSAHDESFFNNMFAMLKLKNTFQSVAGEVSTEAFIETNPDVIIALDWAEKDADESQKVEQFTTNQILNNPKLKSMSAVANKQVYVMDYNYLFSYSYQSLDGLEILAKQMYPDLFK